MREGGREWGERGREWGERWSGRDEGWRERGTDLHHQNPEHEPDQNDWHDQLKEGTLAVA